MQQWSGPKKKKQVSLAGVTKELLLSEMYLGLENIRFRAVGIFTMLCV
jgi:hypothetical protein